jgi:2-haloacid dehalogenase
MMAGDKQVRFEGIQAVVFDAYGTLFNIATPVATLAASIGEKSNDLVALWRRKQLEYTWLRSLMGVHADFWTVTRDALDYSLEALSISEQGLADELMTLYLKLEPYDDAKAALQAVKAKGKRTAILSNGSPSMLDSMVRHAGFETLLDEVLSVEEVGVYKPSRRVYRLAMQKFHITDAPSVCFVSANTWDAQGAAQFGFQVARVARTPTPDDRLPGKPKAVIASLTELAGLV